MADAVEEAKKVIADAKTEKQAVAKQFDVKALALSTKKIYSVEHPALGTIRYGLLTSDEVKPLNLTKITDNTERMYSIAFAMLKKADPSITRKEFDAMPFDAKTLVTDVLAKEMPSFLPLPQSDGSLPAAKRKKQD